MMLTLNLQWTVYYLFEVKYRGMSPPDGVNLYDYWHGKQGITAKLRICNLYKCPNFNDLVFRKESLCNQFYVLYHRVEIVA